MRAAVSSAGWSPARAEAALTSVESMHVILSVEGSPMGHWGTYPRRAGASDEAQVSTAAVAARGATAPRGGGRRLGPGLRVPEAGELGPAFEVGLALGEEGADDVRREHGGDPSRSLSC